MSIAKIEPSGCTVRKGKVQLRFSFYLEPGDPRYEECHTQVPIIPLGGYPGEVDIEGNPINPADYETWKASLPRLWRDRPFHNHFVYVDPDATTAEIRQLLTEAHDEFLGIWSKGEDIDEAWQSRPLKSKKRFVPGDESRANISKCERKVEDIKGRAKDFERRKA